MVTQHFKGRKTGMINQQVNLFQPIFRKERKLLSFKVLIQACAAVLIVLLIIYGWSVQQTQQIETDLAQLKKRQTQFSTQLAEVSIRLAGMKTDTAPQLALTSLEQELAARQKVVAALTRVKDSYTHGISNYLESFSRQAPKGVWLTGFSVQAGGEGLVIRGRSLQAALVPTFLQQLSNENALSGTEFGLLQIQREKPDTRFVDFTVYTGTQPPQTTTLTEVSP
ncbi:MAG: PilN domain-containing protein [Gammaproteobacteria bacterium]|nr:PilN domain-containing protein [Gammaproteobacteria bacterium]